jgi:hypothetical protein
MSNLIPSIPPTYPYQTFIKTPTELGSSTAGNLDALKKDIKILGAYKDVLLKGESSAQTVSPLGNKYFIDTGSTCKDSNGESKPRFVYMNNVPDGTSILGGRGLLPGILGNLEHINPMAIFHAFDKSTDCQEITMPIRDNDNITGTETHHVNNSDIKDYSPCWFNTRINPVTNASCRQGMTTRNPFQTNDKLLQLYFTGISAVGVYILYNLLYKKKYNDII